jgi:putative ABC transport system permease protein
MNLRDLTPGGVPLAWSQLRFEGRRFFAAICGIIIVTMSTLFQTGIYTAFLESAVQLFRNFNGELTMISTDYRSITVQEWFPEERLFQTLEDPSVEAVARITVTAALWRNVDNASLQDALLIGIEPAENAFRFEGYSQHQDLLRTEDAVLYDRASKPVYGGVEERLKIEGPYFSELLKQKVRVVGTFELGPSFAFPGGFMTSQSNFYRLQSWHPRGKLSFGAIKLKPGAEPAKVAAELQARMPSDVSIMTKAQLIEKEQAYWNEFTAIGFIIPMSLIVSLAVGAVVIYQILYTNVTDQLKQYATLKAIGYTDRMLAGIVMQQALLLSLIGFMPGMVLSFVLFRISKMITGMPFALSAGQLLLAFMLTTAMCAIAGILALSRLRQADPAEVFA